MSQDDIAAHFKIRRVSVTQWEGDTTKPQIGRLSKLADLLNTTSEWLLEGRGERPSPISTTDPHPAEKTRGFTPLVVPGSDLVGEKDFPIYAAAAGGSGHLIINFEPVEWAKRPTILEGVPHAYGLLVYGDSMSPAYRHGDMALVHPGLRESVDEDVVLYDHALHDEHGEVEAIIKHLVTWSDMEWTLEQYNPPRQWRELRAGWPTCHRVVGKYGRRR